MTEETRKGIILFSITDRGALYSSYMSFAKNGGVFIPTSRSYGLGDEVFVLLKMMDDSDMIPIRGNVVWVTPTGAQGNKAPELVCNSASMMLVALRNILKRFLPHR